MRVWQVLFLAVLLGTGFAVTSGCSARQEEGYARPVERGAPPASMRPARPIDEEKTFSERLGEITVVIVGIAAIAGGILLPILLL